MHKDYSSMWRLRPVSTGIWLAAVGVAFVAGTTGGYLVPRVVAAEAARPSGDAPTKVLIDNDQVRVSLVSFPTGFDRAGGMKRDYDQVIVFLDDGDYTIPPRPGATPRPPSSTPPQRGPESSITPNGDVVVAGVHPQGTVAWHPKGSANMHMQINKAFRQMYIEIKK
jgi:hypothetical protein